MRACQQSVTALSTSEAEYMAISDSAKEARSLLKLNTSLDLMNNNNIKIYEDNRGALKWTSTQSEPNRTKHIDVHFHHIKDMVQLGRITVVPVETELQLADAFTKALPARVPQGKILWIFSSILVGVLDLGASPQQTLSTTVSVLVNCPVVRLFTTSNFPGM